MILTQEHYELLKPFEKILVKAASGKYFNYTEQKTISNIRPFYEQVTGTKARGSCSSCGGMKWLERLGRWYVEYCKNNNNETI